MKKDVFLYILLLIIFISVSLNIFHQKEYFDNIHINIYDENRNKVDVDNLEKPEQDLAKKYIKKNDVVLELGARYGSVSCVINKKLNNKYNQVVVEPDKKVWKALEYNKNVNNYKFNIVKGFVSNKKLGLINKKSYDGYAATAVEKKNSTIPSYTLTEIQKKYKLKFNVLIADCEGCLESFLDENSFLYNNLRMLIFEADYPDKCNYDKIRQNLSKFNFKNVLNDHQNVWIKRS